MKNFLLQKGKRLLFILSLLVAIYGLLVILKNIKRNINSNNINKDLKGVKLPELDILVAARDEENVIARLVERLLNLEYPINKLHIYVIDDGSSDQTPLILNRLSILKSKLIFKS